MATFSRSPFIPKRITLNPQCINDPLVLQLKAVNNNMRKIDAYVVLGLKGKRKLAEEERRKDNQSKRRQKETALERQKKASPIQFIKERLPKTGFLDAIRNFILYTAMGLMVPFVLKNLPTILNVVKFFIPLYKFLEDFFGNVLGGVVTAIDFGYKVHDKIRGVLKDVTGGKLEKTFDDLEKNLNTFLNLAVIVGLAAAGGGVGGLFKPGKPPTGGVGGAIPTPSKTLKPGSLSRYNDSWSKFIAGKADIGDRARLLRRGAIGVEETVTKGGSQALARMGARRAAQAGGKFAGKFARFFGRIPIIGPLIDFTISMLLGEKPGRAAARAVGAAIGTTIGGSVAGILGLPSGPGALVTAAVGSGVGGILGDIVGGALYDTLSAFGKPQKRAEGGQINRRGATRVPRSIKKDKVKRPPKQIRQRTMPGKNVGGEDAIKKIFPDTDNDKTMSPLGLLKKNAAVMKRGGVLGNLLSSGVELMALGQKIERPTLMGLEKYLAYVIDSSINDQAANNARMLAQSMFAMASGGIVPAPRTLGQSGASTGSLVAKEIVKSFTAMLNSRSVEIFQNIRREMELQAPAGTTPPGGEGAGGLQVTSDSPDFWLLATAALFENNNPQSGYQGAADVAQAIYNRVSLPGWPKTIREVILQKNQFQPVRDYGGYAAWSGIKDKQSAIDFVKKFGLSQEQLESVSAAILDTGRQNSARTFVGARDNFRSVSYERTNNHLDDSTEQARFGHVFGFEHRGANIAAFKAGKLSPAAINQQIVTGSVSYSESYTGTTGRYKPASPGYFNAIEYITGDRTYRPANVDVKGHGTPGNYHDHIAFKTVGDKERAKAALISAGITIGSEFRRGDRGYHGANLAIDIPGSQWGGSGPIGPKEYAGSAKVRRVLGIDGNFSPTSNPSQRDLTSPIITPPGGRRLRPEFNPANLRQVTPSSPIVDVIKSFSFIKNGKKYVLTIKRINNGANIYTMNGKPISEDEFWKLNDTYSTSYIFDKNSTMASSLSPKLQHNKLITNTINKEDSSTIAKEIYTIPVYLNA